MAWVDQLFQRMTEAGASDLHMTSDHVPMIRLSGDLAPVPWLDKQLSASQVKRVLQEISPESNWKQFEESGDTDFAYALDKVGRFRINLFEDRYGPGMVARLIPEKILSATQLGLPPAVIKLTDYHKGLVLVTGPTGSGKSTTLAAMIDHLNEHRAEHILTIEDPIEFVHPAKKCLVNQREVHRDTLGFSEALRSALREDPDTILVGEMRDLETISLAVTAAETGILVFGTLHTNGAAATVDRIVNVFPPGDQGRIRSMLSTSLLGVVSQQLVKKADGSLDIVNMGAAGTPLTTGDKALLCVDVWEHAYYIDYRNMRPKFVETFLNNLVNWDFVAQNFA